MIPTKIAPSPKRLAFTRLHKGRLTPLGGRSLENGDHSPPAHPREAGGRPGVREVLSPDPGVRERAWVDPLGDHARDHGSWLAAPSYQAAASLSLPLRRLANTDLKRRTEVDARSSHARRVSAAASLTGVCRVPSRNNAGVHAAARRPRGKVPHPCPSRAVESGRRLFFG